MPNLANVAATLHHHLCTHEWHGYDQHARWGDGEGVCNVTVDGKTYAVEQGDRDCSSSVIECWRAALKGTPYEGRLNGATYTGNMRSVFVASGLFEWKPMSFIAQRGDIYLNEVNHTAMCQTPSPDMLSEFGINEKGTITGGRVGDQTGYESRIRAYYDYPWDGILHYNGKADSLRVHKLKSNEPYYLGVFLVGAYQEILGDMHNLFGDTNAVHVSVDENGYSIDKIIDGETIADVLDYVQYDARKLVRTLERWVTSAVKEGRISLEEGKEFLSNYRSGLYGYTYLDY